MSDYICGTCKYYDSDMCDCEIHPKANKHDVIAEQDTCDDWTDPVGVELTKDERYDGGVMSNFDNENPKEVEDYINEKPA